MSNVTPGDVTSPPSSEMPAFPGRYISVTSFRRDGTGVATPVWFVQEDVRLLVETEDDTYKVKRICRNPSVTVASCTASGRLRGSPIAARAELLPDSEVPRVERLMQRKYRVDMVFVKPVRAVQAALHRRRPRGKPVIISITST